MDTPTISVVIPTWNSAETIVAAVRSCLDQTLAPMEVLVCDDGSTDNTEEKVMALRDTRIRWVAGAHSGTPAAPRNRGIATARGEWVAFCDSDDEWLPEKLEKQLVLATRLGCKAAGTNASRKINGIITSRNISAWNRDTIFFSNLLRSNDITCSSALIHASIFKQIGRFPEEWEYRSFEDYIMWLRIATVTPFAFVTEALVVYDDHPATSIRSAYTSGEIIKKKALQNFTIWAIEQHKYRYLLQVMVHRTIQKTKHMIKLCFKE